MNYSCGDGTGLSSTSVTHEHWDAGGDSKATAVTSAAVILTFILVGVPSNLLILVSILRQRLYREPTYIILLNLAIADLLMCLLYMPFTVVAGFTGEFLFGSTDTARCQVCQYSGLMMNVLGLVTLHILTLLSLDRFLFVKYPLKYHTIVSSRRCLAAVLSVWVWCSLISLPPLFGFGDFGYGNYLSSCVLRFHNNTRITSNMYYVLFLALEISIPIAVLIATNVWILHIIRMQMKKMYLVDKRKPERLEKVQNILKDSCRRSLRAHKQLQLLKVFGAILISNIVTWVPFFVHMIVNFILGSQTPSFLHLLSFVFVVSFAVVHPVVQAALIPELRKNLVKSVKKATVCWHSEKVTEEVECSCCSRFCSAQTPGSRCCNFEWFEVLNAVLLSRTEESPREG